MSIRSKNAISAMLLKLLLYKPFRDISISEITGRAGLARQTFYTNFQKKEDALVYLIDGLFEKYRPQLANAGASPENLLLDYFIFWSGHRSFLELLFRQELGYIFQERNRAFFIGETDCINDIFSAEPWQLPYIKASIAGITYELLTVWITAGDGLSVDALTSATSNLLSGRLFAGT